MPPEPHDDAVDPVGCALRRTRWLHWALAVLVVILALGALANGARIQVLKRSEAHARRSLLVVLAREARLERGSSWQSASLAALSEARTLGPGHDLRDEWIARAVRIPGRSSDTHLLLAHPEVAPGTRLDCSRIGFDPATSELVVGTRDRLLAWHRSTNGTWSPAPARPGSAPAHDPKAHAAPAGIVSPDGHLRAVARPDFGVVLVDAHDGTHALTLPDPRRLCADGMAWSADGRFLAVAGSREAAPDAGSHALAVWDLVAVRHALGELALDWPDGSPGKFVREPPSTTDWVNLGRVVFGGLMVLLVMVAVIANQHGLFHSYAKAARAAAEHQRELDRIRSRAAHADKMRALGTLAAGVAHDFNNLLSVIQMSRQLVDRALRPSGPPKEHLDSIGRAVDQGRAVVRDILGYGRDTAEPPRPVEVGPVMTDTLALLRRQFLEGIEVEVDATAGLPAPEVNRGRLEQVLLNLVVNAAEALAGHGRIRLSAAVVASAESCTRTPLGPGPWIALSVEDNGPGIAPGILPRIFEPFFSTKNPGNQPGTGLGLATVWRIAEEEDYGIRVASGPGSGTRFDLLVPLRHPSRNPSPATA